jgi:hypothetical protein
VPAFVLMADVTFGIADAILGIGANSALRRSVKANRRRMKGLVTELLIALAIATCIPNDIHAEPPKHRIGAGDSYSEHHHRPYYFRRYYYAPSGRGHNPSRFHPHH